MLRDSSRWFAHTNSEHLSSKLDARSKTFPDHLRAADTLYICISLHLMYAGIYVTSLGWHIVGMVQWSQWQTDRHTKQFIRHNLLQERVLSFISQFVRWAYNIISVIIHCLSCHHCHSCCIQSLLLVFAVISISIYIYLVCMWACMCLFIVGSTGAAGWLFLTQCPSFFYISDQFLRCARWAGNCEEISMW